jgi:hypothetical protein
MPKQASEMRVTQSPFPCSGELKRLKGFITDEKSAPVAFFNYERRHSWERAI